MVAAQGPRRAPVAIRLEAGDAGFIGRESSTMASGGKRVGEIVWVDLTIPNAEEVREFYQSVTGWDSDEFNMGDYSDYVVQTPGEKKDTVAGIVHARGANADLPPHWLIYVKVENLEESMEAARRNGGEVLAGPKSFGNARYCVLKDPAGAVFSIIEGEAGDGE
jgi:predicted enzyme related to lactoylglutathione lyase